MRAILILPLCLAAAACSSDDGANNAADAAAPAALPAGQWQTSFEVTAMRSTDNTKPVVAAKVGDKESETACVGAGDKEKPAPVIFSGSGYECTYKSSYVKEGTINANLDCTRKGVTGQMMMNVSGSYTGSSFEASVDTNTYLPGPGDFAMSRKVTGHLAGAACAPATANASPPIPPKG
jgi:hypothetical protein